MIEIGEPYIHCRVECDACTEGWDEISFQDDSENFAKDRFIEYISGMGWEVHDDSERAFCPSCVGKSLPESPLAEKEQE